MTEAEKRAVLLAEWKQRQAEDEFWMRQSRKATKRTMNAMKEIYEDECNRSTDDD